MRLTAAQFQRHYGHAVPATLRADAKPQIRIPKKREPNHGERLYMRILEQEYSRVPNSRVQFEPIAFRLPSGSFYSPDLIVWQDATILLAVEVKGKKKLGSMSASILHFKEARAAWPQWKWRFVQKLQDGTFATAE